MPEIPGRFGVFNAAHAGFWEILLHASCVTDGDSHSYRELRMARIAHNWPLGAKGLSTMFVNLTAVRNESATWKIQNVGYSRSL